MTKVAINGFGRIGRLSFRQLLTKDGVEICAINDLTSVETLAHLLKYDSIHGRFPGEVRVEGGHLVVNGKTIHVSAERDPVALPWGDLGCDVVVESTGVFRDPEGAGKHLTAGARKVVISAPAKGGVKTVVLGVNDDVLTAEDTILSNASCTTNCLAPIVKVLDQNFGLDWGLMTTIHSYTGDQRILDNSHRDLRRARAAALNMVPTTTGAAKAVALVYPEVKGKLTGFAMRVPTPNVSAVDLTFGPSRAASVDDIKAAIKSASENGMKGIIKYSDLPLVSTDYAGTNESTIFDADLTYAMGDKAVKILAWYDNEWGYSQRVVDLAEVVAKNWK